MRRISYAKANLMLRVIEKRPDGYHNLQMVNTKIDLYDIITVEKNLNGEINLAFSSSDLTPKDDLIVRIVKDLRNHFNIQAGFDIYIEKQIPLGAGLGGGSMNAATVVDMVLDLCGIEISLQEKIQFVLPYGADIPYGFYYQLALVEGIGEKITPLSYRYPKPFILIYPNLNSNTQQVFACNQKYSKKLALDLFTDDEKVANILFANDLEAAFFRLHPELIVLKERLAKYGRVMLTGSGSVFLFFPNKNINYYKDILANKYPDYLIKIVNTKGVYDE